MADISETRRVSRYWALLVLLLLCVSLAGCGYRVLQPASGKDRKVFVNIFTNKTFRPNLEAILANNMVEEFAKREGLTAAEHKDSDLLLEGTLLTYSKTPISYSATDTVMEYRAEVRVDAVLRNSGTHQAVWKGKLSATSDFPASLSIALQQNSEEAAIQDICRKLAQEIYFKVSQDF